MAQFNQKISNTKMGENELRLKMTCYMQSNSASYTITVVGVIILIEINSNVFTSNTVSPANDQKAPDGGLIVQRRFSCVQVFLSRFLGGSVLKCGPTPT